MNNDDHHDDAYRGVELQNKHQLSLDVFPKLVVVPDIAQQQTQQQQDASVLSQEWNNLTHLILDDRASANGIHLSAPPAVRASGVVSKRRKNASQQVTTAPR